MLNVPVRNLILTICTWVWIACIFGCFYARLLFFLLTRCEEVSDPMGAGKDVWTEKRAAGAARKRVPETPGAAVRCSQVSLPLYHFVARPFQYSGLPLGSGNRPVISTEYFLSQRNVRFCRASYPGPPVDLERRAEVLSSLHSDGAASGGVALARAPR